MATTFIQDLYIYTGSLHIFGQHTAIWWVLWRLTRNDRQVIYMKQGEEVWGVIVFVCEPVDIKYVHFPVVLHQSAHLLGESIFDLFLEA